MDHVPSSSTRRACTLPGVILGSLPQLMTLMNSIHARSFGVSSSHDPDGAMGRVNRFSSFSGLVMRRWSLVPLDPCVETSKEKSFPEYPPQNCT